MAAFENRHHCVAVDLPGHGESIGLSPESYTIEGAANRLLDTLAGLRIEKPVLVGYSMGGRLALYLALQFPDLFSGLFLESASPGLENMEEREARREVDERRAKRLETEDFGQFLEDWYRQPLFTSLARDEKLLRRTIEARLHNDPVELAKSLRGIGTGSQPSLWEKLSELQVPTLAVAGERDEKFVGINRLKEAESPMISFASVSDAGHNVHDEALEPYISLLQDFLETI